MGWGSEAIGWIGAGLFGLLLLFASWQSCRRRSPVCRNSRDQGLIESLGDALIAVDETGKIQHFNALAELLTGVSREQALGQPLEQVYRTEPAEEAELSAHPGMERSYRLLRLAPGHNLHIAESRSRWKDGRGQEIGWVILFRDITEDYRLRLELRESESRLQDFADSAADFYWEMDDQLRFTRVSGEVRFLMGHEPEFIIGKTRQEVYAGQPIDRSEEFRRHLELIEQRKPFRDFVTSWRWEDGSMRYLSVSGRPLFDEQGRFLGYRGVSRDITESKRAEEHLRQQALHDQLTGLPNRNLILDRLEQLIARSKRGGQRVAVLFIDLDDFKKINDSLGHEAGDRLLLDVAERLQKGLRKSDSVGRLGGDEFIVLIPDLQRSRMVVDMANKLLGALQQPFVIDDREMRISASIGIAVFPEDGESPSELLRKADMAMYQVKAGGRNACAFFTEEMNRRLQRRLEIEDRLRGALERGELSLVYQPKIELSSNRLAGFEALLRWNNPELGQVPPDEFIPLAESSGQIIPIGDFVLQQALDFIRRWREKDLPMVPVAINLSPRQFRQPELARHIAESLERRDLPGSVLELEITEGVLLNSHETIIQTLREISRQGILLAMDDFGTGYSSLGYLREFPFDVLKIDRSFIRDIEQSDDDRELVDAVVAMGQRLQLRVVAEGVERQEQQLLLQKIGCDHAQGWLFGKPMSEEELFQWFDRHGVC